MFNQLLLLFTLLLILINLEGYGRKSRNEYIQFLYIAQGSLKELETHLLLSQRVKLASKEVIVPLLTQCESVGRLLTGLIRALENKK